MIKFLALRLIRSRLRSTLPAINKITYKKMFSIGYKFFIFLRPSQIWVIILALLNKTDLKGLLGIPPLFILFNSVFSDSSSNENLSNVKSLYTKLEGAKLTDPSNNLEVFFWVLIILAIIKRFTISFFKLLWIPFKIAFIFYVLKYFGFDFDQIYNIFNNFSLGTIEWFHEKIINFFNLLNNPKIDKNNN